MIENELKYVLQVKDANAFKKSLLGMANASSKTIMQGYLDKNTRIRKTTDAEGESYLFTYKLLVNKKLVEIEKTIEESDFKLLWTRVGGVITKTRVVVPHGDLTWEVDFFVALANKQIGTYLVMAEVEMPEDQEEPDSIPRFITDNLMYAVPRHDLRFVNEQLTNYNKVKLLLEELTDV